MIITTAPGSSTRGRQPNERPNPQITNRHIVCRIRTSPPYNHRDFGHSKRGVMSLGPSISMFGDRHSLVYWLVFFSATCGLTGFSIYRKKKGLAGKYYDLKLIGFLLLLNLVLFGVWKYIVYTTLH